jgi:hypothetical protein
LLFANASLVDVSDQEVALYKSTMQKPSQVIVLSFATVWLGLAWLLVARNWMHLKDPLVLTEHHHPFDIRKSWGAYSPFYSVQEYPPPPNGCEITQVWKSLEIIVYRSQVYSRSI